MMRFDCEQCGAPLRLSMEQAAYVCEREAAHRSIPRVEAEQRWISERRAAADENPADVVAALRLATAHGRIAELCYAAGDTERAKELLGGELALLEALRASHRSDERVTVALVDSLGTQAQLAEATGQQSACLALLQRMLPFAEALHEARSEDLDCARKLSACLNGLGRMHRHLGSEPAALAHFERDIALLEAELARSPSQHELAEELAVAHFNAYLVCQDASAERARLEDVIRVVDAAERDGRMTERGAQVRERARSLLAVELARVARAAERASAEERGKDPRAWLIEQVELALQRRRA